MFKACLDGTIKDLGGAQKNLDALATLKAFKDIMAKEVARRTLFQRDVERCIKALYHELSKHAHGNDGEIKIRESDYTPSKCAALVSFFKLQDKWSNKLT